MSRLLPRIALALVVSVALGTLSACASTPAIGELREVDGGIQIVVPALWADGNTGKSGIEPATVWVDPSRTSNQLAYEVNLADVQAKGGGAQWQAATSSAAAIGTLFSGRDPDDVACKFDITGPIDGPSAGGVLTVGVLAALNTHPLDPKVTMTGTISPDGSIGPVGLISYKLQAADEAGFETVVLPAALTTISDPETGQAIDTAEFATSLGLEAVFVRTIDEAYERFTGERLASAQTASSYSFADYSALDAARIVAAEQLQADVERRLADSSAAPQLARDQLAAAKSASAAGDASSGFALAVDALDLLEHWRGQTAFDAAVAESSVTEARQALLTDVAAKRQAINEQLTAALEQATNYDAAQSLAFPGAVAWLTYARAIFVSLEDALQDTSLDDEPELLADYAGLATQVTAESESVFPASIVVLEAVPELAVAIDTPVSEFVSGYTNFLVAAGDANLTYLRDVAGLTEADQRQLPVTDLVPVAFALADEAAGIEPETQSIEIELEQSSVAMTYYVVTTSLVTAVQVFGSPDMWLDSEQAQAGANAYVADSISQSKALTGRYADLLLSEGLNAGFPLWSAEWGTAAFEDLSVQERGATGASIALNELWYDVITVLAMNAYVKSN